MKTSLRNLLVFGALAGAACTGMACQGDVVAGGEKPTAVDDSDPLTIDDEPDPGSLDDLYTRVIAHSCSGQAGLCHNGQFEPNLSTAALAYENLVVRPSLEHPSQNRVVPGHPEQSLLVDKLRNQNVITQMPLGAQPLAEEDIAAIEAWIAGGALRTPGAKPAAKIDNPPDEPAVGVFDASGDRIDGGGSAVLTPGTTVTFRMTTRDFETADADVPYAVFLLQSDIGQSLIIDTTVEPTSGTQAFAAYDAGDVPSDKGEPLDWAWSYAVPEKADLIDVDGATVLHDVPLSGMSFTVLAGYYDGTVEAPGFLALKVATDLVRFP